MTNSYGSVPTSQNTYADASHDTLVSEITNLMECLKSVEFENTMMAAKLNH
ncbi:hypothetical protein DPMN_133351 [Dreissena polymorpha]|uniref:Uncharacterized protein n=1 Tax=Dreissena polymorpha TaxID=45954 RepID=A0A9D4JCU8_DREPO|nr:hypothetical protein DPMN_133351 [Dreissena polymorpha]